MNEKHRQKVEANKAKYQISRGQPMGLGACARCGQIKWDVHVDFETWLQAPKVKGKAIVIAAICDWCVEGDEYVFIDVDDLKYPDYIQTCEDCGEAVRAIIMDDQERWNIWYANPITGQTVSGNAIVLANTGCDRC